MYRLYVVAKFFRKNKIIMLSKVIDVVNSFIHNSYISSETYIGKNTFFAYGGIATVVHRHARIGDNCVIGQCVTIGSKGSTEKNSQIKAPVIGNGVYIGAGARIIGDIKIGDFCIIAPNSVVTKDVESYSVVGGVPAKLIEKITIDKFELKYQYYPGIDKAFKIK